MSKDFLFELGCEELPSAAVKQLADKLSQATKSALEKAQLGCDGLKVFATPRRLAVYISGLEESQATQRIHRKGPALSQAYDSNGAPTKALQGFMRSCGASIDDLSQLETEKGSWVVVDQQQEGKKTVDILPNLMLEVVQSLPISKPMRWGDGCDEFARPVHWVVALWGEEVLCLQCFGIASDRYSRGHRFHANTSIAISSPKDYEKTLEKAYVVVDFAKRQQIIAQQIEALASAQNAQAIIPPELLVEVCSIVEWPVAVLVSFEERFLEVPSPALIAAMQDHQKCFALQDASGVLLPLFITVSNIQSTDMAQVIAGNEKVMRARLSDAAFFFEQDKKQPLEAHIDETKRVVFQEKLGSLHDKSQRLAALMHSFAPLLALDENEANRAAQLSKCDLLSGMVGEFPELQGLMGYYYALNDKEAQSVAVAINEQYMPRFAKDTLPSTALGTALSLADRLDTLNGIFLIGKKPSGVKDPFKLRRHALAVVRLLIGMSKPLSLQSCLDASRASFCDTIDAKHSQCHELKGFIIDRLVSHYSALSFSSACIQAVLAVENDILSDVDKRLQALSEFVQQPQVQSLAAACKRVDNLLRQSDIVDTAVVDVSLFTQAAEEELWSKLNNCIDMIAEHQKTQHYTKILQSLAKLKTPVDDFFDNVMVMVEDEKVKKNRLTLLHALQKVLKSVADISILSDL